MSTRVSTRPLAASALACAGILTFFVQVRALFGRMPVVWPDESLFAQTAMSLLTDHRLATPLLTGAAAGVTEHAYWYPPGYFLVVATVFAVAGQSLAALRALSVAAAVLVLGLTWMLARRVRLGGVATGIALVFLAGDAVFVRASLVGRPDTLVLGLFLCAVLLVPAPTRSRAVLAGACAGLAPLVHAFGWAAVALVLASSVVTRQRHLRWTAIGVLVPLIPWALYAQQDPAVFLDQVHLNLALHEQPWGVSAVLGAIVDQYEDPAAAILFAWVVGGGALAIRAWRDERVVPALMGFALGSLATLSRQMWHPLFAVPFLYVGMAGALEQLSRPLLAPGRARGYLHAVALGLVAVTTLVVASSDWDQVTWRAAVAADADRDAYAAWTADIAAAVPPGSRVLVSGNPDPSFALMRTDLRVMALQTDARSLAHFRDRMASEVDRVVLSGAPLPEVVELVRANATFEREVTVIAGRPARCRDWMPCGVYRAEIYAVKH